jgi:hypothetical protein
MTSARMRISILIAAVASVFTVKADASPPMTAENISVIAATVQTCQGGKIITNSLGSREVRVADLISRIDLLAKPSLLLSEEQSADLYDIGKALLLPAVSRPSWFPDRTPSYFKCPVLPKEAVALFKYLAGEAPDELRANSNVFGWLGIAYAAGVGVERDENKSRRYYLLYRMYTPFPPNDSWSDGVDQNLVSNINRAGLRPYLEVMAKGASGDARVILADEAMLTDPLKARSLLLYPDFFSLNRLVQLEKQGLLPTTTDGSDIGVWAEAWRTMPRNRLWAERIVKSATNANGGSVPTSSERPAIATLRPYLNINSASVADAYATQQPIPIRALVNTQGRAIYVESCQQKPLSGNTSRPVLIDVLYAARLYDVTKLPLMPISQIAGRPAFGWVMLPAVRFQRDKKDEVKTSFVQLPAEQCAFSAVADFAPPTLSPPNK